VSLSFFLNEIYEWLFLCLSILVGLFSICFGYKKHKSKLTVKILIIGFIFLIVSKLIDQHNFKVLHTIFVVIGGIFIIISHFMNKKLCSLCKKCKLDENKC